MKIRICTAALLLTAASCGPEHVSPKFETVETDTLLTCAPISYDVHYRFTSIANASSSPVLQAIEEANIQYFYGEEGFTGTARDAAAATLDRLSEELRHDAAIYGSTQDSDTEVAYPPFTESAVSEVRIIDTLLVYTIRSSRFTGGAHGMYATRIHNYSLAGGYELALSDLLTPVQLNGLDTLLRNRLYDRFGVSDDAGLAEQGFFPEEVRPTENFAVTENGITFYYNPYDIGCYALGDIELEVGREELKRLER